VSSSASSLLIFSCESRHQSNLRCNTRSVSCNRVRRFTYDTRRQPGDVYSRFTSPFFCGGNVHPLSYNMQNFHGRSGNPQSRATIFLFVLEREIHLQSREPHQIFLSPHRILMSSFHWMAPSSWKSAAALMATTGKPVIDVCSLPWRPEKLVMAG